MGFVGQMNQYQHRSTKLRAKARLADHHMFSIHALKGAAKEI